jgi:hypothetical protein
VLSAAKQDTSLATAERRVAAPKAVESTHDPAYIPASLYSRNARQLLNPTSDAFHDIPIVGTPAPLRPRLAAGAVLGVSDWQPLTEQNLDTSAQ